MRISPISNYSPSFGKISSRAAAKYMSENQNDDVALRVFVQTVISQSLNKNYHVDYHNNLGEYMVLAKAGNKYYPIGNSNNIYVAVEKADEAMEEDSTFEEQAAYQKEKAKLSAKNRNDKSLKHIYKDIGRLSTSDNPKTRYNLQKNIMKKVSKYCI